MTIHHTESRTKNKSYGFVRRNFSQGQKAAIASGQITMISFAGRSHTEASKALQSKNISKALRAEGHCRPVFQFDLQGNLIHRFDALSDAAKSR